MSITLEARVPIEANVERKIYGVGKMADGRAAYLVTYQGLGHYLVADSRTTPPVWVKSDQTHKLYVSVNGKAVYTGDI